MLSRLTIVFATLPILVAAGPPAPPSRPLHQRIDALLESEKSFRDYDSGLADDAEFLRRATLDLTGRIPTSDQVRAFLADKSQAKRAALIDKLLASPEYPRRMAAVFDVMLMERRPDRLVPRDRWMAFLLKSFRENRPWDEMAREILSGDDRDQTRAYRAKFFLERASEPHLVTRDVGRLFLGSDYQCAQCHDHPLIEDYKQHDYYGIFAFVSRTTQAGGKKRKGVGLTEKPTGEATFQSVFDPKKVTKTAYPHVPGGPSLRDPAGVVGYSRRARLAEQVVRADYAPFRRNIANRLWALLMGQGLVEPLDQIHPDNPAANPELFDLLASELAAHKFDIRWFLREVALTRAYQRSSVPRAGKPPQDAPPLATATLKPLTPEQLAFALFEATGLMETQRLSLGKKKATEAAVYARVARLVPTFARAFGPPAGSPDTFDPRLDQALFLANGATVRGWLVSRPGSLLAKLEKMKGDDLADELYLSILGRKPSAEERVEVSSWMAKHPKALADLAWALLASTEFRFNH